MNLATMSRQVARAGKLTTADLASVGLLPSMNSLVIVKTSRASERSVALIALERLAASVGAQMCIQAGPLMIAHPAYLAAERSLPIMVEHVLGQIIVEEERLGAVRAGEPPGGIVSLQVHVQQLD